MLGSASLLLSLAALGVVLGWVALPTGIWPGISLGLGAILCGALEIRMRPPAPSQRATAWLGAILGSLVVLLGVGAYLGLVWVSTQGA